MCWHIFRTFVNYLIPTLSWNECNMLLIIHWLLYNDYLYTYMHLQFWHSRRSRIHKQPPKVFLKVLQISQDSTCVGVSFLESCETSGLQHYWKKTPTQVFSFKIWDILKNTYIEEHRNDCFHVLITSSSSPIFLLHHIMIFTILYSTRFTFSSLLRN